MGVKINTNQLGFVKIFIEILPGKYSVGCKKINVRFVEN